MPTISVTRTYLEMRSPDALRSYHADEANVRFERVHSCPLSFFRYLYREVGRAHHWVDRLAWSDEQVQARLDNANVTLWVMYVDGAPAGYAELERHPDGSIEVVYFGLLPEFTRRGLGKLMLTAAVERAWEMGTDRVWLHTCTLDDPAALPNYVKRGFAPFREEVYSVEIEEPALALLRSATPAP